MKPHKLFKIWKPDEVAECLEGLSDDTVYQKLWSFVNDYKGLRPEEAEEPTPGVDCLADFWDRLDQEHQVLLNILAASHWEQFHADYE